MHHLRQCNVASDPVRLAHRNSGRRRRAIRLHAVSASYLPAEDMVEIVLDQGIILRYPRSGIIEFANLPAAMMHALSISPRGSALQLDEADVHLDVHGLVRSLLSPADLAKELARHGRRTTSERQAEAARNNGRKGGRPRKSAGAASARTPSPRPPHPGDPARLLDITIGK